METALKSMLRYDLCAMFPPGQFIFLVTQACSHKWPTVEEAQRFDALLLTGSHYSAYDDSQKWIPELIQILKEYVDAGDVRIVGCCFGHQVRGISEHQN